MISQTAEYALRAMVYLADQNGESRTTAQISEVTQIPAGYLAKVMQSLGKARLVNAQRGLNGGFTLVAPSREITVLSVIHAVEPIRRYHECPLNLPTHGRNLCPLHRQLDDVAKMIEETFANTTLADLLNVPAARKPLCRFPAEGTGS